MLSIDLLHRECKPCIKHAREAEVKAFKCEVLQNEEEGKNSQEGD